MKRDPEPLRFRAPQPPAAIASDVERVLEGGDEAVAEVRRWVRGAVSPYRARLAAEQEDLEQEVLVELTQALRAGRFRGESTLATYVRRMVHYKCLNLLRQRRARTWVDVEELDLPALGADPLEQTAARDSVETALRVAAGMPEDCRRIWAMVIEGTSYREIGRRLGIAEGAVRVRALRCRRRAVAELERLGAAAEGG
jgi:RNA polymerase sigma-70 factor (ECF subfamily)